MTIRIMQRCLFGAAIVVSACTSDLEPAAQPVSSSAPGASQPIDATYAFAAPEASTSLADELREISGLTMLEDGRVAAIQDENGILFILNPETGDIEEQVPFGDGGDYEGIEQAGDRLFVLLSNGMLLELTGWEAGAPDVVRFETPLSEDNDTESLAYDASGNRLLIVTKEDPGEGLDNDLNAVYAFDLSENALLPDPVVTLDAKALEDRIQGENFKPSATAVHPTTGELYLISSTGRAAVALGLDGTVNGVWDLPENTYEQPEGIAFLPDGDILIASEGGDGLGMLHRVTSSVSP